MENAQDMIDSCESAEESLIVLIDGSKRRIGKTYATKCLAERYLE